MKMSPLIKSIWYNIECYTLLFNSKFDVFIRFQFYSGNISEDIESEKISKEQPLTELGSVRRSKFSGI